MIVYCDVFSGDELYSDGFNITQEGCMDVIKGRMVEKGSNDYGIAANADEDAGENAQGEGLDDTVERVIDVVDNFQLQEQAFTKNEYMAHIKGYMKRMVEHLQKENPERIEAFKVEATAFVKKVIAEFKNITFYSGQSNDIDNGCVVVCIYGEDGMTPYFYFFRDGMRAEKY